jgi:hypothetical protein
MYDRPLRCMTALTRQHNTISLAFKLSFQIQYLAGYRAKQFQVLSPRGT